MQDTPDSYQLSTEQFYELAKQELASIQAAVETLGLTLTGVMSVDLSDSAFVGRKRQPSCTLNIDDAYLTIHRTVPKAPKRFLDFLAIRLYATIPVKDKDGLYPQIAYGRLTGDGFERVDKAIRPGKTGFKTQEIAAEFVQLANRATAARSGMIQQGEQVEYNRSAGRLIERLLADHFMVKLSDDPEEPLPLWSQLLDRLEVHPCNFHADKVVIVISDIDNLIAGPLRLSTLILSELSAKLPLDPLLCHDRYGNRCLKMLVTEDQAKAVIPILVEVLKSKDEDTEENTEQYPELLEG